MTTESGGPVSGKMTWAQAISGPLAGATCLWQDLDGLHVEPAPEPPPPTSLIWGWRGRDHLARLRLDGDIAYVAIHNPADSRPVDDATADSDEVADLPRKGADGPRRTLPWASDDGRIRASRDRGPSTQAGGVGTEYKQLVVEGITGGAGPITFVRPVSLPPTDIQADDDAGV